MTIYFEESEQKIEKCKKCGAMRNIIAAPECPVCKYSPPRKGNPDAHPIRGKKKGLIIDDEL